MSRDLGSTRSDGEDAPGPRRDCDRLVHRLSDGTLYIRKKKQSWIAVPVESGLHLETADIAYLTEAIDGTSRRTSVFGVLLEELQGHAVVREVSPDEEGLASFNQDMAHFNVALVPADSSWIVVLTTEDYFLVMGPKRFVNRAVGGNVEKAYRQFEAFAGESERLKSVGEVAERRYARAKTGQWVIVPGHTLQSLSQPDLVQMEELALRA